MGHAAVHTETAPKSHRLPAIAAVSFEYQIQTGTNERTLSSKGK